MNLREYQLKAIKNIKDCFIAGKKRVILQLPTGAGKTIIFTAIAKQSAERGSSVLVITDRIELLTQAGGAFQKFGITPQFLTAKTKELNSGKLWVGMVETIKRRLQDSDYQRFVNSFNLIIIDEAHKQSFNKLFESIHPMQFVIGATATPYRVGKMQPLKENYDTIVIGEQIPELITTKYLSPAVHYGIPIKGLKDISLKGGEFDQTGVNNLYNTAQLFEGVVLNYKKHSEGKKALLFAASVENSIKMQNEFKSAGYRAIHLDAETPQQEREQILSDYKKGEYDVLCNVGILTTGFDDASVEVVIVYRPTMSLPLWLQMCGRGSRINQGKEQFIILDFGENVKRHGFWDAERFWSLENAKPPKKMGAMAIKECPECGALIPANAKLCKYCGYEYQEKKKEKSAVEVVLEKLTPSEIQSKKWNIYELEEIRRVKEYKIGWVLRRLETYQQFEEYGKLKNYKRGWARWQWHNRIKDSSGVLPVVP